MHTPPFLSRVFAHANYAHYLGDRFNELEDHCTAIPGMPPAALIRYTTPPCAAKNRYRLILPLNPATQITLACRCPAPSPSCPCRYINASFMPTRAHGQHYIATQAPVSKSIDDFWWMVWERRVLCVVMLVAVDERLVKALRYWGPVGQALHCRHGLAVTVVAVDDMGGGLERREVRVVRDGHAALQAVHYLYAQWPDHSAPASVHDFHRLYSTLCDEPRFHSDPVVVHCRYACRTLTL